MTPPATADFPDAFLVLTGGQGRRLGGVDKASLQLGRDRLIDRAIAGAQGRPVVVIGPGAPTAENVIVTREDPPGGGPAAGLAAGAIALSQWYGAHLGDRSSIALLAVDQPGVTAGTWGRLITACREAAGNGAVLARDAQRQYGVAVVAWSALRERLRKHDSWTGRSLRYLLDPLLDADVPATATEARDIDTLTDLEWWTERSAAAAGQELDYDDAE